MGAAARRRYEYNSSLLGYIFWIGGLTRKGKMGDSADDKVTGTRVSCVNGQVMHPSCINENMKAAQYAVRGELYLKGEELRKAGREVVFTNIGNPQALGLKPNTYNREPEREDGAEYAHTRQERRNSLPHPAVPSVQRDHDPPRGDARALLSE